MKDNVLRLDVDFDNTGGDRIAVAQCARYIRSRLSSVNAAEAWISVGQYLSRLKSRLIKNSPRGSNERIGWKQAFQLQPREFAFTRRHADRLVIIGNFFGGHTVSTKNLPLSVRALHLIATKLSHAQIGEALRDGEISVASTEAEVRSVVKKLAASPATPEKSKRLDKHSPLELRVTAVRELMTRLQVNLRDLKHAD